jgi:hypothetical protein
VISTQQHAKSFGKRLYLHLSRNNTVPVTPLYVKTILEKSMAASATGQEEGAGGMIEGVVDDVLEEMFSLKSAPAMVVDQSYFESKQSHCSISRFGLYHAVCRLVHLG